MKVTGRAGLLQALSIAGTAVLAGTALTGCSANAGSGDANTLSIAYQQPPPGAVDPIKKLVAAFTKAHPGIKVKLQGMSTGSYDQTLSLQLNAGTAADLIATTPGVGSAHGVQALAQKGMLQPLGATAKKTYSQGGADTVSYQGKVYSQALSYTPVGLVGNRDIIGSHWPKTFDDLLSWCKTVKASGKAVLAVPGVQSDLTGELAQVLATSPVYGADSTWDQKRANKETTFADTAGWQEAIGDFDKMKDAGCFQDGAAGAGYEVIPKVAAGNYYAVPTAGTGTLSGDNLSVYPMPTSSGKELLYLSPTSDLSLTKSAKDTKDAETFLEFAASKDASAQYSTWSGDLPLYGNGWDSLPASYSDEAKKLLAAGQYVAYPSAAWPNADVANKLGSGLQGILTGQASVKSVLESADSAW